MKMSNRLFFIVVLSLFVWSVTSFAGGLELKPYGFLKGDMVYATKGVLSFANKNLLAPVLADTIEKKALGFTSQNSRFGLKGTTGEKVKVGGQVELDFFTGAGSDANAAPRIRLAFGWVKWDQLEMRIGQQWDIFSPNNPLTNNINGNMYYAGNLGFRRTQFQFLYSKPMEQLTPMVQLSIGEATKETAGMGADNYSGMPMIQGRVSAKFLEKHEAGVYFMNASFDPDPNVSNNEYSASGVGVDFNLPFSPLLTLKGEFNTGTNLSNCNLFTIAGNGSKSNDHKSVGLWMNVISKPYDRLRAVVGFGFDQNKTENLVAGALEKNMVVYGDAIFDIAHGYSLMFELENITTSVKGGDDRTSMLIGVGGMIVF